MTQNLRADQLRPGDTISLCGRIDTVARIETPTRPLLPGRTVHLYTPDDPSDPYLMKPDENVPVHSRT